jgi:hypothetical protein
MERPPWLVVLTTDFIYFMGYTARRAEKTVIWGVWHNDRRKLKNVFVMW